MVSITSCAQRIFQPGLVLLKKALSIDTQANIAQACLKKTFIQRQCSGKDFLLLSTAFLMCYLKHARK